MKLRSVKLSCALVFGQLRHVIDCTRELMPKYPSPCFAPCSSSPPVVTRLCLWPVQRGRRSNSQQGAHVGFLSRALSATPCGVVVDIKRPACPLPSSVSSECPRSPSLFLLPFFPLLPSCSGCVVTVSSHFFFSSSLLPLCLQTEWSRHFVREGPCLGVKTERTSRYLFLLSDTLIVGKPKSLNHYSLKARIKLKHAWLVDEPAVSGGDKKVRCFPHMVVLHLPFDLPLN